MNKKLASLILALVLTLLMIPFTGVAEKDKVVIACAHRDLGGASGNNLRAAYYYVADQDENVEIMFHNSNGDVVAQANYLEDCIASGNVDAAIVWAVDPDGITDTAQQCVEAGIPVVTVDIALSADSVAFVAADNHGLGVLAGESAIEYLTKKYGEPKGKVYLMSSQVLSSCRDRDAGFLSVIEQYPDVTWDAYYLRPGYTIDDTSKAADDLMQMYPEGTIDVFYGALKSTMVAYIAAAQTYNRNDFAIVGGFDYDDAFVNELKKGEGNTALYSFTAQDCFAYGAEAMKIAIAAARGEAIQNDNVLVEGQLVNPENLEAYMTYYNETQEIMASYQ